MVRRTLARLCIVAAFATALVLATAAGAAAAPSEPTLSLSQLQDRLDASPDGTLPGYFKTVCKGATIETIPLDVLSITGGATSGSSLIFFEAKGPRIDKYGGIVSGMSGSPVYVLDGAEYKLVGALSYGDYFTLGGSGLATPIEYMSQIEEDYAAQATVRTLAAPVVTGDGLVDRVIVSSNPKAYAAAHLAGAFVAKPLGSTFIGGLRPGSKAYETLKANLEKRGLSVVKLDAPLSPASDSSFATDLAGGASVAALASRGELWLGSVGTVTYAVTDTVLAFGHSAAWSGQTRMFMCNAWIDGIWPSRYAPYKMGRPTAVRGTFTQDRYSGIRGTLTTAPVETPVRAHAVNVDTGAEATSTAYLSRELLDRGELTYVVGAAASLAGSKLFDQEIVPGSAHTTTTVHLESDGVPYTVMIRGFVDDSEDIAYATSDDADWAVYELLSVLDDALEHPVILSVDVESAISSQRRSATISAVRLHGPLREGGNRITVDLLAYGVVATQSVDVTLTIPAGTMLTGTVVASNGPFDPEDEDSDPQFTPPARGHAIPWIVDSLNASTPGSELYVSFAPSDAADDSPAGEIGSASIAAASEATLVAHVPTPWVIDGMAGLTTAMVTAEAAPNPIAYGGETEISGEIAGASADATVRIYGTYAGEATEHLLTTLHGDSDDGYVYEEDGSVFFTAYLGGFTKNTTLRILVEGTDSYAPGETYVDLGVKARVTAATSASSIRYRRTVTLTANVAPDSCVGDTVVFQYYYTARRQWRTIATRTLVAGAPGYAKATASWKPPKGAWKVRASYQGGLTNRPTISATRNVTAK